jgi:hypothetical protein
MPLLRKSATPRFFTMSSNLGNLSTSRVCGSPTESLSKMAVACQALYIRNTALDSSRIIRNTCPEYFVFWHPYLTQPLTRKKTEKDTPVAVTTAPDSPHPSVHFENDSLSASRSAQGGWRRTEPPTVEQTDAGADVCHGCPRHTPNPGFG